MNKEFTPNVKEIGNNKTTNSKELLDFPEVSQKENMETFYEKIQQKIDIIKNIRKIVESHVLSDSVTLKNELDSAREEINKIFGEQTVRQFIDFNNLKAKLVEIRFDKSEEIGDEEIEILRRMQYIENNNIDVSFLDKVNSFFDDVLDKRTQVIQAEKDYQQDARQFPEKFFKDLSKIDKIEVEFSGYNVNFIIPPESFEQITGSKSLLGRHFTGKVFNIIKDQPGKKETIKHEDNHTLTESFIGGVTYWPDFKRRLERIIKRIVILRQEKSSQAQEELVNNEFILIRKIIENYYRALFNEAIADVDFLTEGKGLGSFFANFLETAEGISKFGENIRAKNEDMAQLIREASDKMLDKFVDFIDNLALLFFIAGRENRAQDFEAAIILFKSEQMHRVMKYAQWLIGRERFEVYKSVQDLISQEYYFDKIREFHDEVGSHGGSLLIDIFGGSTPQERLFEKLGEKKLLSFFNPENVEKLNVLLEEGQQELEKLISFTSDDKKGIRKAMSDLPCRLLFDNHPDLLESGQFLQYIFQLENINKQLGGLFSEFIRKLPSSFYLTNLELAVEEDNCQKLDIIYKNCDEHMKKFFIGEIKNYFKDNVFEDYVFHQDISYTPETIKDSSLWRWVEKVGLDKEIIL